MSNRQLTTVKMLFIKRIILIAIIFQFCKTVTCNEVELKDWPPEKSRNISIYLSTKLPKLPPDFCKYQTKLLIIVFSKPENIEARNAIRNTWGKKTDLTKYNTSLYFLLGQRENLTKKIMEEEYPIYEDLIFENFIDRYSNLTLKSVAMLKIFTHQKMCQFLLKADDDVYVDMEYLLPLLQYSSKPFLAGRLIKLAKKNVNVTSRWYTPSYMYRKLYYPNFLAGPSYVMSKSAAIKLYKTALTLPLFHLEDVFITGICAKKANVSRKHIKGFTDYKLPLKERMNNNFVTFHRFNPKVMQIVSELLSLKSL